MWNIGRAFRPTQSTAAKEPAYHRLTVLLAINQRLTVLLAINQRLTVLLAINQRLTVLLAINQRLTVLLAIRRKSGELARCQTFAPVLNVCPLSLLYWSLNFF